jgi:hypothetical protein
LVVEVVVVVGVTWFLDGVGTVMTAVLGRVEVIALAALEALLAAVVAVSVADAASLVAASVMFATAAVTVADPVSVGFGVLALEVALLVALLVDARCLRPDDAVVGGVATVGSPFDGPVAELAFRRALVARPGVVGTS